MLDTLEKIDPILMFILSEAEYRLRENSVEVTEDMIINLALEMYEKTEEWINSEKLTELTLKFLEKL